VIIWKLSVGKEKRRFKSSQAAKTAGCVKPLSEIAVQHKDRKMTIIAAYKTAAYSQREIGECSHLHQQRFGAMVRKNKNSCSVSSPICTYKIQFIRNKTPNASLSKGVLNA
jgi:hypothetical protein